MEHGQRKTDRILREKGFSIRTFAPTDLIRNVLANSIRHIADFSSAERKTGFVASKSFITIMLGEKQAVPACDASSGLNIISGILGRLLGLLQTFVIWLKNVTNFFTKRAFYLLLLFAISIGYVIIFSYISIMKYYTFQDSMYDLGLWNQMYWLTLHGGPAAWDRYAFNFRWQYPYHKLSFVIFLPFYAVYPHPETLLILQSAVIGLAAVPLYFLTLNYSRRHSIALLVSFVYLAYYSIQNVNLFDFQSQNMFPLFFFAAIYFFRKNSKVPFAICTLTAALTSPLNLMTVIMFLFYAIYQGQQKLKFTILHPWTILGWLRIRRLQVFLTLTLIGILVVENYIGLIYPYTLAAGVSSSNVWQSLIVSPDGKIQYFVMLLAPLAFLPLLDPLMWILSMPFVAYTLFSQNKVFWQVFGVHYPLSWAPVLFLGLIRSIRKLSSRNHDIPQDFNPKLNPDGVIKSISVLLLLSTLIFAMVYSPIGPLNSYIKGGYWAGNENLSESTHISEDEAFLHEVIALVPPNGSVLTQNDIPELSGRYYLQVAPYVEPNMTYDYILGYSRMDWYSSFNYITPYINEALKDGTFGILAWGHGAILLKRGYTGDPVLHDPYREEWMADNLPLFSGSRLGNVLVHAPSRQTDLSFWYGPYVALPPGIYQVNLTLKVESVTPGNASIITLDVVSPDGVGYYSRTLQLGDFSQPDEWKTFSLEFKLTNYNEGMQFRGMSVTNATTISMAGLSLKQISPNPNVPLKEAWTPAMLRLASGSRLGDALVHAPSGQTDLIFWYGPYVSLQPGAYRANFTLKVAKVTPEDAFIIKLEVVSESGSTYNSIRHLQLRDFRQRNEWKTFSLGFNLTKYTEGIEFRGTFPSNAATIYLASISLEEIRQTQPNT
jgi:uncharacterized membrane protein